MTYFTSFLLLFLNSHQTQPCNSDAIKVEKMKEIKKVIPNHVNIKSPSSSEDDSGSEEKEAKIIIKNAYKVKIIKEIQEFLENTVLTVIVTHADEDHYNLIPTVTHGKTMNHVILGGKGEDYEHQDVANWLRSEDVKEVLFADNAYYSIKESKQDRKIYGAYLVQHFQ